MAQSLNPSANSDPEAVRFNQKLVDKLKYCKEVLISIKEAQNAGGAAAKGEKAEAQQMQTERGVPERQERATTVQMQKKGGWRWGMVRRRSSKGWWLERRG
ncbi:hypothetical protein NP233_g7836 [Leucocoprinus birnbaumii]|uniref:Uncharacterized protein n=1 Tax=Leucocoprinus birnbaumii TaxID=56174 RepID=A0AAD5VR55_9AGAR|nr:hypothetical protein NP233_g7836 [Leucocoprinus birnbaumii]